MKRNLLLVILFSLVLTACAAPTPTAAPSTSTSAIEVTATVAPTATKTERPTATATEIPPTPTERPPKDGDWKMEKLADGSEVKVYVFDLKDADGNSIGLKQFYNLTSGYPLYWNDFIQVFPINAWFEYNSNGDNPIQAIKINSNRNVNGTIEFDRHEVWFEDRIKQDSKASKENYTPGLLDTDPTSSFFKYTLGKNEFTLAPNHKTGLDVFILRNDPNLENKYGFVSATVSGKYPVLTANWGNTKVDESVRTAIVSIRPPEEMTDQEWMEFLLMNATSLFIKTDQTKPYTSTSADLAKIILNDPKPFIQIIRVSPAVSPTSTP